MRQTSACIAMYADGYGHSHTTSCSIHSLYNTRTRTPSVLPTWLMDKLQRSDTLVGDLQSPRESLFKKL